jgi:aryl-alcohol dehydrogenase-like predicted oxidoreductase
MARAARLPGAWGAAPPRARRTAAGTFVHEADVVRGAPRADLEETDYRHQDPRFADENLARNLAIVEALNEIGRARDASAAQVALAWLLAQGDDVVPIPGCKRRVTLEDSARASGLALSAAEIARLDAAAPPGKAAGPRYAEGYMRAVNL